MQDLQVIGVENGGLLVVADDGTRFRIPIDEVLQSKLRHTVPDPASSRKLAPREIQAQIRAGMSAEDVAAVTGVPIEYIQKFEGPVLAERDFVIKSARGVRVHTALETDTLDDEATFGSVIDDRLKDLGAVNDRWASWKEPTVGWVVKLSFTANQIDHDARWKFDPKKLALDPTNSEAITLSQQGESVGVLIPRLRAVGHGERHPDSSRFDSGAFDLTAPASTEGRAAQSTQPVEIDDVATPDTNQTADLLDALRRRRGEREAAQFEPESSGASFSHPSGGGIRLVDIPLDIDGDGNGTATTAPQPMLPQSVKSKRSGRAAMPSWDEIVFGARTDDDLA